MTAPLQADSFYNSQSFQGFTGIINTPNAEVLEEGKTELQISNQVDAERVRDKRYEYRADQYMINFGILPNLEFGGRLANIENKTSNWATLLAEYASKETHLGIRLNTPNLWRFFL